MGGGGQDDEQERGGGRGGGGQGPGKSGPDIKSAKSTAETKPEVTR